MLKITNDKNGLSKVVVIATFKDLMQTMKFYTDANYRVEFI